MKKLMSAPVSPGVRVALMRMSKAALADCLADALGIVIDGEPDDLISADVAAFCNPRLAIRHDAPVHDVGEVRT